MASDPDRFEKVLRDIESDVQGSSLEDALKEARRELAIRKSVYPRWVKSEQYDLTQEKADRQIADMARVVKVLEALVKFFSKEQALF